MCSPTGIPVGVRNNKMLPNFRFGTWHLFYAAFTAKKLSTHVLLCKLKRNDCSFRFYDYLSYCSYILFLLNPLNPELNPICCLLALLGAHHFLHVSRIRVKSLTFRLLMSYIYIYIYDISRLRVNFMLISFCVQQT